MSLADLLGNLASSQAKAKETFTGADYVKWLRTQLTEPEEDVQPMKPGDWLRASKVGWLCMREEAICARQGVVRKGGFDGDTRWTMDLGTGIHWVLQNLTLGPVGEIVGEWKCTHCTHVIGSYPDKLVRMPKQGTPCPNCGEDDGNLGGGGIQWEYVEMTVADDELLLSGHLDGLHPNGTDKWEFKSAAYHAMKRLKEEGVGAIYQGYKVQGEIYRRLSGRSRTRYMFVNKGDSGLRSLYPLMEHRNDALWEEIRTGILDLREALEGGKLPRRVCGSRTCSKAKGCPVASECFVLPA
jgi:hypothetical protein